MAWGEPDVPAPARPRDRRERAHGTRGRPTGRNRTGARALRPVRRAARGRGIRFLHALNPIAKLAAPLPFMVALVFTRGFAIPLAFIVLVIALLLVGARLTPGARSPSCSARRSPCSCSA